MKYLRWLPASKLQYIFLWFDISCFIYFLSLFSFPSFDFICFHFYIDFFFN
jgi:hypothetical protein